MLAYFLGVLTGAVLGIVGVTWVAQRWEAVDTEYHRSLQAEHLKRMALQMLDEDRRPR